MGFSITEKQVYQLVDFTESINSNCVILGTDQKTKEISYFVLTQTTLNICKPSPLQPLKSKLPKPTTLNLNSPEMSIIDLAVDCQHIFYKFFTIFDFNSDQIFSNNGEIIAQVKKSKIPQLKKMKITQSSNLCKISEEIVNEILGQKKTTVVIKKEQLPVSHYLPNKIPPIHIKTMRTVLKELKEQGEFFAAQKKLKKIVSKQSMRAGNQTLLRRRKTADGSPFKRQPPIPLQRRATTADSLTPEKLQYDPSQLETE